MITIFKQIDLKDDYEIILSLFLKKEHVDSERQWIELYQQINHVSEEYAYTKLSQELTTVLLSEELENVDYFEELKNKIGDTSCLCMNKDEIFYEKSFANNINTEFIKISKIDYDTKNGLLFISGLGKKRSNDIYIYMTLSEHADSVAKGFLPMRRDEVSEKEFEEKQKLMMAIWNDKTVRIPFMEKVKLTLKTA